MTETALLRRQGMITAQDLCRLRAAGAVADTTGRFFAADGREIPDDVAERALTVDLAALRGRVVLLAAGTAKCAATVAVLRSGLVNGAILDGDLAEAIMASGDDFSAGASAGGRRGRRTHSAAQHPARPDHPDRKPLASEEASKLVCRRRVGHTRIIRPGLNGLIATMMRLARRPHVDP